MGLGLEMLPWKPPPLALSFFFTASSLQWGRRWCSTDVVLAGGAEARGQKETHRDEERGARCAAKVPGVIDVMTVYPSCCVATA